MSRDRVKELQLNVKGQSGTVVLAAIGGNLPPGWVASDLIASPTPGTSLVSVFCSARVLGEPFSVGVGAKLQIDADSPDVSVSKDGHPDEIDLLRVADLLAEQLRNKIHEADKPIRGNRIRVKLDTGAQLPGRKTSGASGYDLCALHDVEIPPMGTAVIKTGVHLELPPGTEAQVRGRSGLARDGLLVHVGTIDSDYTGDVSVVMVNLGFYKDGEPSPGFEPPHRCDTAKIKAGDRVAQLVFGAVLTPELEVCEELSQTERGECGFGSTGK